MRADAKSSVGTGVGLAGLRRPIGASGVKDDDRAGQRIAVQGYDACYLDRFGTLQAAAASARA